MYVQFSLETVPKFPIISPISCVCAVVCNLIEVSSCVYWSGWLQGTLHPLPQELHHTTMDVHVHVRMYMYMYSGTLYSGHHWDHSKCPDFRGFLISGVDFIHICMYLWQNQVSEFEGCPDFRGVWSEGFHCIAIL